MILHPRAIRLLTLAASLALPKLSRAATPVYVQNESGFEGLEEATVLYYPDTNTFVTDPNNYPNHVDEGGGLFRDTLRNNYATLGWWDGDRDTTNTDRQRTEAKGISGLSHQKANQTYEYAFDFRANPGFSGTSHFCHIFQLKETENGSSGFPLVTVSLYKSGSTTQGEIITGSASDSGSTTVRTFSFTPDTWTHVLLRISTTDGTTTTGGCVASVNGDAFSGSSNVQLWSDNGAGSPSNDYRTKFGFYRGIGTSYGVPAGDSWIEHRTINGYSGTSNLLTWKGGSNSNAWDTTTQNFLNGASAATFNVPDTVNFTDSTTNTTVNLTGSIAAGYVRVNATQNYTFAGSGSLTAGTLRKDGAGQLTLATSNSYMGLTDVRAGTLLVSGSVGNNSLVSIAGGVFKAGSSAALGTNSTIGTEILGGTLDINGFNLSTEPITVQGAGNANAGAIVNNGAQQTSALTNVTLTGDATFGGTGRWDIRGTGAKLSTGSSAFNLTKTGTNQISLVGASVDPALANITVNQGILSFQTSTTSMGDATKNLTVNSGAVLGFFAATNPMSKVCALNGGTVWGESGTGNQNTFSGPLTLGAAGGTLDAGGGLTGGASNPAAVLNISGNISGAGPLTKNGPGTVTLSGSNNYAGNTTINSGTLVLNRSFTSGAALNIAGGASMKLGAGAVVLKSTSLSINSSGSLDLASSALIVDYTGGSPLSSIRNWISQGNLTSAAVAADASHRTALGYADSSSIAAGPIAGVNVDQTSVIVRYTLLGDVNLDQVVDTTDFTALASHFGNTGASWSAGDFNNDGVVNALDFNLLSSNFGAPLPAPSFGSPLPEPSFAIAIIACLGCSPRRRRERGEEKKFFCDQSTKDAQALANMNEGFVITVLPSAFSASPR